MESSEMKRIDGDESAWIKLFKWVYCRLSWQKILQLAVLAFLCGLLYFAWEARWKFSSEIISRWAEPEIVVDRLPQVIEGLSGELKTKTIFVWSFNVTGDTKRPIYVSIDGIRRPELEGKVEPLFPDSHEGRDQIIKLIQGDLYCAPENYMARYRPVLRESGVEWGCAVSIPPEYRSIIGAITVGFTSNRSSDYGEIRSSLMRWADFAMGRDH
jgi:hypothetical protein